MDRKLQMPGWTNAWTMPIKTRVDMLTTGVRTPVGVKVHGSSLAEIERIGTTLEHLLAPVPGTRSVLYERSQGGLYVDIVPDRRALARYGLTVGALQRTIEAAIGGAPVSTTVEGRNRFSINVRYPQGPAQRRGAPQAVLGRWAGRPRRRAARGWGRWARSLPLRQLPAADGAGRGRHGRHGRRQRRRLVRGRPPARPSLGSSPPMLDVGAAGMGLGMPSMPGLSPSMAPPATGAAQPTAGEQTFVPLGLLADVRVATGPPMIRDEGGFLVGYVYVDVDPSRDVGGTWPRPRRSCARRRRAAR
jgi:Cu(I)/Ag(I) efflux system membrane protein CusA/SilA